MKKIIPVPLAFAIAAAAALPLGACSRQELYSETFRGYMSPAEYRSQYAAISGFVKEELSTSTVQCVLGDYEIGTMLPENEMESIAGDLAVNAAYPVKITYTDSYSAKEKTASAYLLETAGNYRYFSPLPKSGEALTASYYNSVIANPAYSDCTVVNTYSGHMLSIDSTYYQIFMFDNDKAYFKQTIPAMQVDFYMTETEDGFEYYSKIPYFGQEGYYTADEIDAQIRELTDGEFYFNGYELIKGGKRYPLDSFKSISELSTFIYAANFDNSFFEKTDYGFCMTKEKFNSAVYALAGEMGENVEDIQLQINEHIKNIDVRYYVSKGRLARIDFILQALIGDSPKDIMSVEMHSEFKDFGSTDIVLPR